MNERIDPTTRQDLAAEKILAGELPIPIGKRWQPLRAGLMNLFLFEDERFPFAGGRLLLRGSNGTGKSRVLAMTLPLLLDGSLKATRVEPDRDPTRQVAWNVLGDDQHSATGYSWLEFGRLDEDGEHYITIGMGIRAVRDGAMKSWFFVTPRRIDDDLALQSIDGVPLTEKALEETLGSSGQVIKTAAEYRRVVDETLFRLADRYDPLIDLLLQLRQPQLAKKLDIEQLEAALRAALPPLKQSLLDDAAEAFRELDVFRSDLAADQELLRAIESFMRPYREHVRRGVLRAIKQLTSANSRYETEQRNLRGLSETREQDQANDAKLAEEKHELRLKITSLRSAIEELQQSPEMLDANRLDERKQAADRLADNLHTAETELAEVLRQLEHAESLWQRNRDVVRTATQSVILASEQARETAAPEAIQNLHLARIHSLFADERAPNERAPNERAPNERASDERATVDRSANDRAPDDPPPTDRLDAYQAAAAELQQRAETTQRSAAHLIKLSEQIDEARRRHADTVKDLERSDAIWRDCSDRLQSARRRYTETADSIWQRTLAWYGSADTLHDALPTIELWSDEWHAWAETPSAEPGEGTLDPSSAHLQKAHAHALRRLAESRSQIRSNLESVEAEDAVLSDERRRLQAGEPIRPIARPGHDVSHRDHQPGAPLWQLIDFVPSVPETERAGWEAALEDAGLLDAWVTPDGNLVAADDARITILDVQLHAQGLAAPPPDRQLSCVLSIDPHESSAAGIETGTLERILSVIGVGADAGSVWVASDGNWRNGPLRGHWSKPLAQYIGRTTRARFRDLRLREITDALQQLADQHRQIDESLDRLDREQSHVESLIDSFPRREPLYEANLAVRSAEHDTDVAADQRERCREKEHERAIERDQLIERRDADAADSGLAEWAVRATELSRRLENYRFRLQTLDARVDNLRAAVAAAENAEQASRRWKEQSRSAKVRSSQLKTEYASQRQRVAELEATVGSDAAAIMVRLETIREELKRAEAMTEVNDDAIVTVSKSLAVTDSKIDQAEIDAARFDTERREAADWFASLDSEGLLPSAFGQLETPPQPWSMTQALKLGRQLDADVGDLRIDDDSWNRSQTQIHEAQNELQQTIFSKDGYSIAAAHLREGLQKVTLTVQGETRTPTDAIRRLNVDIENRKQILSDREQEALERFLLGEVAEGLRAGMRNAAELIALMTNEVSKRPMKTGMQMRFKWQRADDGPAGLAEACEVLTTSSATWSADEREQIKRFLQQSIGTQRDSGLTESWHDHLAAALDYRSWHRIVIERRSGPEAAWQKLTRRTYGSGSGGEKAISLTLPQLAAAAAYYRSADELAPRFILLDEAFAGVSPDMREACMDLIEAFELDVVMTSENEWGMYPGVSQLAICQLDRFADIDAVVNRVFIWNGTQLRSADSPDDNAERANQPLLD